jgi:ATP-binding cassette subfamily B protein
MLRHAGPLSLTVAIVASVAMMAAAPAASVITGTLVGSLVGSRTGSALPHILLLAGVLTARQIAETVARVAGQVLALRIDGKVRQLVRELALAPAGIGHLEDSGYQAAATRACDLGNRWRVRSIGTAAAGQITLSFRFGAALASAAVLAAYFPLLAVWLFVATVGMRAIISRQWLAIVALDDDRAVEERQKEYWSELAAGAEPAKEVRLFGMADWLLGRRRQAELRWLEPSWTARRAALRHQGIPTLLAAGVSAAALLVPSLAAGRGELDPGQFAVCLVAAWGVFGMGWMGMEAFDIQYGLGALRSYRQLLDWPVPAAAAPERPAAAAPERPAAATPSDRPPAISFEDLHYGYASASAPVLRGLSLLIEPGEVLGIVGVNGAGKTTLIKLLAGLYAPAAGHIRIDGHDLAGADLTAWRRRLAVVFQDFVQYPATAGDNVALSAPEAIDDVAGIGSAVRQAGAQELLERLPRGLDTGLWRGGADGTDLSGGQWQKLAIARALFAVEHGRQVLVLDEPTAHLDVASEAEFFDRVVQAVDRKATIILISHRLVTLRRADRIVVLSEGRVSETGSHAELMSSQGDYARLFDLQAQPFRQATL